MIQEHALKEMPPRAGKARFALFDVGSGVVGAAPGVAVHHFAVSPDSLAK